MKEITGWTQRDRFRFLLLALTIAASAGLVWGGYRLSQSPATRSVTQLQEQSLYTLQTSFDYHVRLQAPTTLWPEGTVLAAGRPLYFRTGKPQVWVQPVIELMDKQETAPDTVRGTVQLQTQLKAIREQNETVDTLWSQPLDQPPAVPFMLHAEGPRQLKLDPIMLDLETLYARFQTVHEELGRPRDQHQVVIEMVTETAAGPAVGLSDPQTVKTSLPLTLTPEGFTVPAEDDLHTTLTVTQPTEVVSESKIPLRQRIMSQFFLLGTALLTLMLVAGIWLYARRKKAAANRQRPAEHHKYRDWITEGTFPLAPRRPVKVHHLAGLVDLAIDMNKRVVYDPSQRAYFVVDDNLIYMYRSQHTSLNGFSHFKAR